MSATGWSAIGLSTIVTDIAQLASITWPAKVVIPAGVYKFDTWPTLHSNRVEIIADGPVFLVHTGSGDAVTFDGTGLPGGGMFNCRFEGFTIVPGPNTHNSLVLKSYHHSRVDVRVHGAGAGCAAVAMLFCVCTEVRPVVSNVEASVDGYPLNTNCQGVLFDAWPAGSPNRTTACVIRQPILEGLNCGMMVCGADLCTIEGAGGTIEDGVNGIWFADDNGTYRPGSFKILNMEMEGNTGWDIYFGSNAHNCRVVNSGNPALKVYHSVGTLKEIIPNNKVISTTDLL